MTLICFEVQPLLPIFSELDKLRPILKVTGLQALEASTSWLSRPEEGLSGKKKKESKKRVVSPCQSPGRQRGQRGRTARCCAGQTYHGTP